MQNSLTETPFIVKRESAAILRFQGSLVDTKVEAVLKRQAPAVGSTRGKIIDMSPKSRVRMIKKAARVTVDELKTSFITLTYPHDYPSYMQAKTELFTFLKRLRRYCEKKNHKPSGFWRLEPQVRGAPHFHILLFNVPFIPMGHIQKIWNEIISGGDSPSTRIERIRSRRGMAYYMSKYITKQAEIVSGFIYAPYLTALNLDKSKRRLWRCMMLRAWVYVLALQAGADAPDDCGRHWGIWLEDNLPYAPLKVIELSGDNLEAYYQFRRYAARKFRKINKVGAVGFFLLTDSVEVWFNLVFDVVMKHDQTPARFWKTTGLEMFVPLIA